MEWLRYSAEERGCSPGTMRGRRSEVRAHFLPAFGDLPLESVTTRDIERWRSGLPDRLSVRTKNKLLTELGGIFKRAKNVWGLPVNPVLEVEPLRELSRSTRPKRFWRSSASPPPSRRRRSSSPPPSLASVAAS
jgi:hypothetical protein